MTCLWDAVALCVLGGLATVGYLAAVTFAARLLWLLHRMQLHQVHPFLFSFSSFTDPLCRLSSQAYLGVGLLCPQAGS